MAVLAALMTAGVVAYDRLVRPEVTVTDVVEGPVVHAFYATGTLQPDREYPLSSNVEGIITEMRVDKGDRVDRDQAVAVVRAEDREMRFSQALAEFELKEALASEGGSPILAEFDARLQAAREQLAIAQRELARLEDMRRGNAASQADLDRTNDRVQISWSLVESLRSQRATRKLELARDLAVARSALEIAQWNLDQQTIRSPIDGMVLDRPMPAGARAKIGDELLRVADVRPSALVMRAAVDEEDKTRVREGQPVRMTLYAYPARVFSGQVKRIYPQADPDRRTFEIDVTVAPTDEGFSAGMTGELAFIVDSKASALVVPSQAVQQNTLWLVRDGRLARREVRVGLRSIERAEIIAGVDLGERIVVSALEAPMEGRQVRTRYMDPAEAAGLNTPPPTEAAPKVFQ